MKKSFGNKAGKFLFALGVTGLIGAGTPASADILILAHEWDVGGNNLPVSEWVVGLRDTMSGLSHEVVISSETPQDLSRFNQVWDLRFNDDENNFNIAEHYINQGGSYVFIGEHRGFTARNNIIINKIKELGGGDLVFTTPSKVQQVTLVGPNVPLTVNFDASNNYDGSMAYGGSTTAGGGFFVTIDDTESGTIIGFNPGQLTNSPAGSAMVIFDSNMFDRTDPALTALTAAIVQYLDGSLTQKVSAELAQESLSAQNQVVVRALVRSIGARISALRGDSGLRQATPLSTGSTGLSGGDEAGWDLSNIGIWGDATRSETGASGEYSVEGKVTTLMAGVDYVPRGDLALGLAFTYERGRSDFSIEGGAESNNYMGSLYGVYHPLPWLQTFGFASVGRGDNKLTSLQLGNKVTGSFDSTRFLSTLGARAYHQAPLDTAGQHRMELSAGLHYNYAIDWLDDYTASNDRPVDQGSLIMSQVVASFEATYLMDQVQPYIGVALEHDLINNSLSDKTGGVVNLGARLTLAAQMTASLDFSQQVRREGSRSQSIAASFRYRF